MSYRSRLVGHIASQNPPTLACDGITRPGSKNTDPRGDYLSKAQRGKIHRRFQGPRRHSSRERMNLPNRLTLARLAFSAVFVLCFTLDFPFRLTAAFAVFLLAALSDMLDGIIARRWNLITDFGKLMDPLADKILTASAFICLIGFEAIPPWAVILIISREFLITGLRSLSAAKGIVIPADNLGKHKTTWQMITITYFLLLLSLGEIKHPAWFETAWQFGTHVLVPVTVILSVYSGLAYLFKNRSLIKAD